MLPYNIDEHIYEEKSLNQKIHEIRILLINKAVKNKVIISFLENQELNYELIKNIFQVRIINLEELSIKLVKDKETLFIQIFDEKAFDQKIKLNIQNLDKKDLRVRINKKVKLFE